MLRVITRKENKKKLFFIFFVCQLSNCKGRNMHISHSYDVLQECNFWSAGGGVYADTYLPYLWLKVHISIIVLQFSFFYIHRSLLLLSLFSVSVHFYLFFNLVYFFSFLLCYRNQIIFYLNLLQKYSSCHIYFFSIYYYSRVSFLGSN